MRKPNYFDDDSDDIKSILSSFDAPREVKKEEVAFSLKEIEATHKAAKEEEAKAPKPKPPKTEKPKTEKPKTSAVKEKKQVKVSPLDSFKDFSKSSSNKFSSVAHSIKEKGLSEEIESLSKGKRTRLMIILIVAFLVFVTLLVSLTVLSVKHENKRIEKFNSDAGKVCSQYVTKYGTASYENLYPSYGVSGYRMTGLCFVREIDFDNDNIGELMLCYNDSGIYYAEVWGYNKDKDFVVFYHDEIAQTDRKRDDVFATLYFKNNKVYIGKHSGKKCQNVELFELKGNSFVKTDMKATYTSDGANYSIGDENNSADFERIRLAVLTEEKAALNIEKTSKLVESYLGSTTTSDLIASANNMQSAYYQIVLNYNQEYGKAELIKNNSKEYVDGLAVVDLIDFNGDGTDELLVIYRRPIKIRDVDSNGNYLAKTEDRYYIEIYRYNGTKAVLAYKNERISTSLNDDVDRYYIIKRQNDKAYYCANAFSSQEYGRVINASSTVFKMKKGRFVQQYKAAYSSNYGYNEFYIDDQQVYKATFDQKGYEVPLFDGSSSYDSDVYTVTYLQRKRLKADKLDLRVEKTINNIKKLNPSYSGK